MNFQAGYTRFVFQDFESYLRRDVDLVENDIKLVLDEYNSKLITYELEPAIYRFKDLSDALLKILKPEYEDVDPNSNYNELDDIKNKTKLVVRPGIKTRRFDENSFFSTLLGFTPGWHYKHYNEYISHKIVNLSTTNKIHLKCDCPDGSLVNGLKQPILLVLF